MIDLAFRIDDVVAARYAAAPQLTARVQIDESSGARIHAIALRCQVNIEPQRRAYDPEETVGLADQFGARDRWSQTLKPFAWMQCSALVQGFIGSTMIELPMPVTYDLEVTASKYLHQLDDGEVPLASCSPAPALPVASRVRVEQVPWHLEDAYRMPVRCLAGMHG